jgi:hypothetical protein
MGYNSKKQASLGLLMTLIAIASGIKPTVFGSDMSGERNGHYFQPKHNTTGSTFHDFSEERKCLRKLLDEKLITMQASGL